MHVGAVKGVWTVVSEVDIPANTSYVDFSDLDINRDAFYILDASLRNANVNDTLYYLFFNGIVIQTSYYSQRLSAVGITASANGYNDARVGDAQGTSGCLCHIVIAREPGVAPFGGFIKALSNCAVNDTGNIYLRQYALSTATSLDNVTSIRLSASQSSAFAVGSHLVLCRLKG